jgi:hypothetical protein
MISPEGRILACAAVLNAVYRHDDRLRRLMAGRVDGDRLIAMAVKEGLAGVLYRGLEKAGVLETLSGEQRARLQSLYYLTLASNVTLIHELAGILELINRERIPVVLLQGIALLRDVYVDPGLRPTTDIDLWVLPADRPYLARILVGRGYEGDPLYPTTFRNGTRVVDLHTHLFWAERIRMREHLVPRAQEGIFQSTQIVHFAGHEVRTLGPYDQVTYLILHALKHGLERLIWLVDIMGLVSGWGAADWEGFLHRARDLEQERSVSLALFLLVRLFEYQPSGPAQQLLERQKNRGLEEAILRRRVPGQALPPWAHLILLSSGKNWRTRLLFILESLFPRPEILRQSFPDLSEDRRWVLYWKRILQICGALVGNGAAGG